MKICQLTNHSILAAGGDSAPAAAARALGEAGHDVTLVFPDDESPAHLGDAPRFFSRRHAGRAAFADTADPGPGPDVVHAHDPFLSGEEALRIAARNDAPVVFTADLSYEPPHELTDEEASVLRAFIEKLGVCFANRCDIVVATSPELAVRLFESGVTRPIRILPEPVRADARAAHALRLEEIYGEAVEKRRLRRGPVPAAPGGAPLGEQLVAAWSRVRSPARTGGRAPRGVLSLFGDDSALPC